MTDLRHSCIEAMAEAMTAKLKEHPTPAPTFGGTADMAYFWGVTVEDVASAALDALLSTLTEHADEWTRETQKQIDEYYNLITSGRFAVNLQAIADELLAVLRNPDQD